MDILRLISVTSAISSFVLHLFGVFFIALCSISFLWLVYIFIYKVFEYICVAFLVVVLGITLHIHSLSQSVSVILPI